MKKNEPSKLVTVAHNGTIVELGGISGPIINPCKVQRSSIIAMINNQKKVYEVNPTNPSEKVLLNLINIDKVNFPEAVKTVKANVAPTVNTKSSVSTKKQDTVTSDFSKK